MENGVVTSCGRGFCLRSAGKTTGKCAGARLPKEWLVEEHAHSDEAAAALFIRQSGMVTGADGGGERAVTGQKLPLKIDAKPCR